MKAVITTAACALLLAACGERAATSAPTAPAAMTAPSSAATAPAPALTGVTFNMSWLPQGSMAGVIVAIDKGYYAARGLEVDAVRGFGGIRTANEVDQGMFDFGYVDPVAVALNRARGGHTRLVGIINQSWPGALCFIEGRHRIGKPTDLRGLTVGGGQNSPVQALLPRWLTQNDVNAKDVRILQLNPSVIVASLIEGRVDAAECWRGNSRPLFAQEARAAGHTLGWIDYATFNLDIHGAGIATTDRLIAEKPQVVQGFVAATMQGYQYAADHPGEARDIMLRRYPQLDSGVTLAQIEDMIALVAAATAHGRADPARMVRTLAFVAGAYEVAGRLAATDLYTNEFVPP